MIPISTQQHLLEIQKYEFRKSPLGGSQRKILSFFVKPDSSVYDISKFFGGNYKNRWKQVQSLYSRRLLRLIRKKSDHGAKYYRLTSGGIYNLIWNDYRRFALDLKALMNNYSDDPVFNIFLDPYFDRQTVSNIQESTMLVAICKYLYSCCQETEEALDTVRLSRSDYVLESSFWWYELTTEAGKNAFLKVLKSYIPDLRWKGTPNVYKTDDDLEVKVTDGKNIVAIRLDRRKKTAKLFANGKERPVRLAVSGANSKDGLLSIGIEGQNISDFAANFLKARVEELASRLALELIIYGSRGDPSQPLHSLSTDKRFMSLASNAINAVVRSYQEIFRNVSSS